jgi:GAF domain
MRAVSREDLVTILTRLAKIGALATKADGCFIFLLAGFPEVDNVLDLELLAYHSQHEVNIRAFIERHDRSPVGWIALHGMPLNLCTVDEPREFAEVYKQTVNVQSFFGAPLFLSGETSPIGVIACDSTIENNFSRFHVSLLEQIASHISDLLLKQKLGSTRLHGAVNSWEDFTARVEELVRALGTQGIDILRLSSLDFASIEQSLGLQRAVDLIDQFEALIQQSLPPQFPLFRLPNGDMLVVLDKMMSDFFENKIHEIVSTLQIQGCNVTFARIALLSKSPGGGRSSLEEILATTTLSPLVQISNG